MIESIIKHIVMAGFITSLLLASNAAIAENEAELSAGLVYIDGQSQTSQYKNTQSLAIPVSLIIKQDRLSFGVSISYLSAESKTFNEKGIGDTTLMVGYDLTNNFTLKLKEKLPAPINKTGLSTGENDTSAQLDYFARTTNNSSLFGTLGYKFVGQAPGEKMKNSLFASIGAGHFYTNKASIGVSLDYRQSMFKNLDDQLGLTAYINQPLNSTYSLSGFAGYDDTQTSSLGVSLTTKF